MILHISFRTVSPWQTVQTQIRLLLEEKSDLRLHCLQIYLHHLVVQLSVQNFGKLWYDRYLYLAVPTPVPKVFSLPSDLLSQTPGHGPETLTLCLTVDVIKLIYHNDLPYKFSDRESLANSADPDLEEQSDICQSICMFWWCSCLLDCRVLQQILRMFKKKWKIRVFFTILKTDISTLLCQLLPPKFSFCPQTFYHRLLAMHLRLQLYVVLKNKKFFTYITFSSLCNF